MFGNKNQKKHRQVDLSLYAIYDTKTDSYEDPRAAVNDEDLCRHLINLFCDPRNSQYKHFINAEDYAVYRIGNYCRSTGTIESYDPQHVANCHELRSAALAQQADLSGALKGLGDSEPASEKNTIEKEYGYHDA